jgi:hypothetical protein
VSYTLSIEQWREAEFIEERNEHPLLVALVAAAAAWSLVLLIALA